MSNDKVQSIMALKPCPFCGFTHTLKLTSAEELANEGEDDPEPWMHSDSFAVMCDGSRPGGPGGCGASGGFQSTEAMAIAAWNRREAIAAPGVAQGSFMTREAAIAFCKRCRPGIEPTEQHIAATIDAYSALFGDLTATGLPRLENCGCYLAKDNTGQWHYINHAGTWQSCPPPFDTAEQPIKERPHG